jgi:CubicO group peptidase (beta-lactamase class C family)
VGISSRAVLEFIDRIDRLRVPIHGFILLRGGAVAAEGYWAPFHAERKHRMYSVSKSFVSLAVGLLTDRGRLSLDDQVARFFPDKTPDPLHRWLATATVRDLLMMATPHSTNSYTRHDTDWVRTFFEKSPSHPPGTIFSYDTAATVVLGTIVERLAGMPFLEAMREHVLDPIGFSKDAWCIQTPEGSSWGGSGVICTLRDMAKVAQVCADGGKWGEQQLISHEYIAAATAKQIDNTIAWGKHGYGYQIWRIAENGFAFIGMGSQLAFCFPDRDFVFACVSDTQGIGPTGTGVVDAFWEELYETLADESLAEDREGESRLAERIATLEVLPQAGSLESPVAANVDGVTYRLEQNPMGITRLRLRFHGDEGLLEYWNAQGDNRLRFGIGRQIEGEFPQKGYFGKRIGTPADPRYDCLASGAWVEPHKLNLLVYITDDYFGTLRITCAFKGEEIAVYMTKVAEWFLDEYEGFAGGVVDRSVLSQDFR